MTTIIKTAEAHDVYTIISLQARIWQKASSDYLSTDQMDYMFGKIYNPDYLKEEMARGQTYAILYENNAPQGFVSHSISPHETEAYRLNKIFVLHESQGKGFGKHLMQHVMDIAHDRKAEFLDLYVNRKNPACEFYKKLGFAVKEEVDIPVGPYFMNDYVMRKAL